MKFNLFLSKEQVNEITDYLEEQLPLEACGLLVGKNDQGEKILFVENQAKSPVRFVMDPLEQLKAFDWIDDNGLELLGIFHSHPAGPETASSTDIAEAAYDVVHVICSRNNNQWRLLGFWIESGNAIEISLQIV